MSPTTRTKTFSELSDEELVRLIFGEGDRLPKDFAQEVVARGQRIAPLLAGVIQDRENWFREDTGFWSAVHATLLLGAIGAEKAVPALIDAMFCASEADNDWVNEQMASIWGAIGPCALEELKEIALDPGCDCYLRERAMGGMAAIALRHPELDEEIFRFIGGVAADEDDDPETRSWAAHVLLDFQRKEHEELLLTLARSGVAEGHYAEEDVRHAFADEKRLYWYQREWLDFYDADKIAERRKRWESERLPEDEAWKCAVADVIAEDSDRSLPNRKKAAEQLGALLALARNAEEALEADEEDLPLETLKEQHAAAMGLHSAIAKDPSLYRSLDGYLRGDLLDWIIPLPDELAGEGLVDEAASVSLAWSELTHAESFLADRALILAKAGRADEARAQIDKNVDQFPGDFWVYLKAADAGRTLKDFDSAPKLYRRCLNLAEHDYERREVLERLIPTLREAGKTAEAAALEAEENARLKEEERRREEARKNWGPKVRQTPKVGRNDPCPCGSGKKFKKCCAGQES